MPCRSLQQIRPLRWTAILLTAVAAWLAFGSASAATDVPRAQVLAEREESLGVVRNQLTSGELAENRQRCATGSAPATIERSRALGSYSLPDAADDCAAVLHRLAEQGALLEFYRTLGDAALPEAIGAAVADPQRRTVSLGNGRAAVISAALAWDSGFTVAYQRNESPRSGMPDAAALKPRASRCLALTETDLRVCYAVGYAYGVLAANGLPVSAVGVPP